MPSRKDLIRFGEEILSATSHTARLDSELLLQRVLELSRLHLLTDPKKPVSPHQEEEFQKLISRRSQGEPVAYLIGTKEFWGYEFLVTKDTLIPRPETEHLLEQALKFLSAYPEDMRIRILDLGTGTGCIAISLARELKKARTHFEIVAADRSTEALSIAKENATRLGVESLVSFVCSDWFQGIPLGEGFHLIVSNPPYVDRSDESISPELAYEPEMALYAEECGLRDLGVIVSEAPSYLVPGGMLITEMGCSQGDEVMGMFEGAGFSGIECYSDLAGLDRGVSGKKFAPAMKKVK